MKHVMHSFPMTVFPPDARIPLEVRLGEPFRFEKLIMAAWMAEIRGHFKIKHTRLPLLNRENVIAYSNVTKVKKKRRTTVEYREHATGNFVRSYLPENVVYVHTDPLSYMILEDVRCGNSPPQLLGSVSAEFFKIGALGNGVRLPTTDVRIMILLHNTGDIPVTVTATAFGVSP